METIALLGPPLDQTHVDALMSRLSRVRDEGFEVVLVLASTDLQPDATWQAKARRVASEAARIIVIEPPSVNDPAAVLDPEGRYRRALAEVFARLEPKARERCIPCWFGLHTDASTSHLPAGPRGRPVLDLALDAAIEPLVALLKANVPELRSVSSDDGPPAVLSDHAAQEDGIGFDGAIEAFVDLLQAQSTKPPIVASVEGGWGVGKSSFLNLARKKLREKGWKEAGKPPSHPTECDPPNIRTVWFNAWSNDGELSAFAAFALALIRELTNVPIWRRPGLRFRLARARFDWASGWRDIARLLGALSLLLFAVVLFVLGWTTDVEDWLKAEIAGIVAMTSLLGYVGIQRLWGFFTSPLTGNLARHFTSPDYDKHLPQRDTLHEDIERIIDVYTQGTTRLYVFVDDLDRADPAKVAELTQTIALLLAREGSRTIYVLAMDREKVAAALAARHKEIAGIVAAATAKVAQPLDFGQAFIEKLVQLPFRVPSPGDEELKQWVRGIASSTEQLEQAVGMIARFLGHNPRRVKQFVNLVHLRLRIVTSSKREARLSFHQLAKLTALEIIYPFFVGDMIAERALLNTLLIGAGSELQSEAYRRWSAHSELLELLSATLDMKGGPSEVLGTDRMTSLVDLDLASVMQVALPSVQPSTSVMGLVGTAQPAMGTATVVAPMDALVRYSDEYERIRQKEPFTPQRTAKLDRLFDDMARVRGLTGTSPLELFESGRDGRRIAAIASSLAETHATTGKILERALEAPRSLFEIYQTLRVMKLVWSKLPLASQRALAVVVSTRFLNRADEHDAPIWSMTLDILAEAKSIDPGPNITITLDDGEVLHRRPSGSFDDLTEEVYHAIAGTVEPWHYGTDWRFFVGDVPLVHAREHDGGPGPGAVYSDLRSLAEMGVKPGTRLQLRILQDRRKAPKKK